MDGKRRIIFLDNGDSTYLAADAVTWQEQVDEVMNLIRGEIQVFCEGQHDDEKLTLTFTSKMVTPEEIAAIPEL